MPSITRSVARNTILQATGRAVSVGLAFVVFFLVARQLGVDGYGQYATATAFLQLFAVVVDLGLYIHLANVLGQPNVDERRVVGDVVSLRLVTAVILLGLAPLVVLAFPYPPIVKLSVAVLAVSSFMVTATQLFAAVFQKYLVAGRFIAAEVLGRLALLGFTLAAIQSGAGLLGISWTVAAASTVSLALTVWWARRLVPFHLRLSPSAWRAILRVTWPIAVSITFNVIYFKADTIILSLFHSDATVGIYGAPYRVFEALISVPALFAGLLTPILSGAFAIDRLRFQRVISRGFEALLVAAVGLVVGTQFVANDVMTLIAPEFAASGPILRVLVLGTAAIFIGYLFSNAVVVVGAQRRMMWAYVAVALSSIGLYFLTIPRFSYWGAAWVTVAVEGSIALIAAIVVLRSSGTRLALGRSGKVLLAGVLMAAAMWIGRPWPWYLNGAVGAAVYGVAILGLGVVRPATIRSILSRTERP